VSERSNRNVAKRMTPAVIAVVIAEIDSYTRGERVGPIRWTKIGDFSGFSRVSLQKHMNVKRAFSRAKQAERANATPRVRPRSYDEATQELREKVAILERRISAYNELFRLHEYNVKSLGHSIEDLERPIPPIDRRRSRSR
jgi:hypothetical protein